MKEQELKRLTDMIVDFVGHIGKKLPDDVVAKLEELASKEDAVVQATFAAPLRHNSVETFDEYNTKKT